MALNMSDSAAVMSAYSSVIDHDCNWLLLHYINDSYDELGLHSYGKDGLEELKTKLSDNKVFIAFYKEEADVQPGYIIINYVPTSTSGLRRARALVHARRVGVILKEHQTILTVDNVSFLTAHNIHEAIVNPEAALTSSSKFLVPPHSNFFANKTNEPPSPQQDILIFDPPVNHLPSQAVDNAPPLPPLQPVRASNQQSTPLQPVRLSNQQTASPNSKAIINHMPRQSFGAIYAPEIQPPGIPPPVPPLPKGTNLFTGLLRRKKKTEDPLDEHFGRDLPPPTPPKDKGLYKVQSIGYTQSSPPRGYVEHSALRHQRSHSMSDFAVISHVHGSDELIIEPDMDEPPHPFTIRPAGKWAYEHLNDPEERARLRRELQLQRETEEREAIEQEAERQRQIKLQKEEFERQEIEDELRRKAEVEEEIRRITAERRRREQLEWEEEDRKQREIEERRRRDRERRLEEHRRLEEWRKEQARKEEAAIRQAEETKLKEEAERREKIKQAVRRTKEVSDTTGWITIQNKDSLSWKRRFYKFSGTTVFLHRSPTDLNTLLERVDLRGKVEGFKEWNEGHYELEAIAFSFVIEFKNQDRWSLFADSEEEKYKVLGLFKGASGL